MVVYLDVIWFLNLLFDSLLLYLTAIFLKREIRLLRIFAGGIAGSLMVLFLFTPFQAFFSHPLAKFLLSAVMVLIVFGFKRWRFFFKSLMALYLATFLLGGALIGAHYFIQYDPEWNAGVLLSNVKGFGDPISWLFVLVGFPIAWHFSRTNVEHMEMAKIQFEQIVSVTVLVDTFCFRCKGLVDSGNQLYDPLSKMPVMIISVKNHWESLPEPLKLVAGDSEAVLNGSKELPVEWQDRLKLVPYSVVGQEHQLTLAIKPDFIRIKTKDTEYLWERGLVSFTFQQLSADDTFQCIVHPKMLTGEKQVQKEYVS